MAEPRPRRASAAGADQRFRLESPSLGCDEARHGGRRQAANRCPPGPLPRGRAPAVSPRDVPPPRRGEAPTTSRPALTIAVTRQFATVVVTLDGPLEEGTFTVLRDVLWDVVVGQGNLSVTVDARELVVPDPVFVAVFTALRQEAAHMGGTLAVLEPLSLPAPSAGHPAGTPLDFSRARRRVGRGMADHPAGGARSTHRTTRGAQDDPT
jgi:hypothetical protein